MRQLLSFLKFISVITMYWKKVHTIYTILIYSRERGLEHEQRKLCFFTIKGDDHSVRR
jgi:hypothetical protein